MRCHDAHLPGGRLRGLLALRTTVAVAAAAAVAAVAASAAVAAGAATATIPLRPCQPRHLSPQRLVDGIRHRASLQLHARRDGWRVVVGRGWRQHFDCSSPPEMATTTTFGGGRLRAPPSHIAEATTSEASPWRVQQLSRGGGSPTGGAAAATTGNARPSGSGEVGMSAGVGDATAAAGVRSR